MGRADRSTKDLGPSASRLRTFRSWWETQTLGLEEQEYEEGKSVHLTLRPEWQVEEDGDLGPLPVLFSYGDRGSEPVVMERKLGEGGMGEVWSGWQGSLGREVAVKKLRGVLHQQEEAGVWRVKLLREAYLTGLLEHPNIVPVHLLGLDGEGQPAFAMKRIRGVSWSDVIAGKEPLPEGLQGSTPLERQLRILKQVCNALHFAHSKGIIHRDLKPDNVMIGSFGEVYVMDWGIAVSLDLGHGEWLRAPAKGEGIFGTPAYMAPEVAMGSGGGSVATDVYLLGAVLHELLTGKPPHEGETLYEVLYSAVRSQPYAYEATVPQELVAVCRRAMHPDPSQRFSSAEAFRQALAGYLTHRASRQLSAEASARLLRLKLQLDTRRKDEMLDVYQLFGQVRFGFQQALRTWSDNTQAKQGLQEALECMIRFELRQQHTRAAAILLAELPVPNPSLEQAIRVLSERVLQQQTELNRMRHDADLSYLSAARVRLMLWMALLWGLLPFSAELAYDLGWRVWTAKGEWVWSTVGLLGSGLCIAWWRDKLQQNQVNRSLLVALVVVIFQLFLLWLVCLRLGIVLPQILALESIPALGFFAFAGIVIDHRLRPALVLYAFVPISSLLWPSFAPYATSLGNTVGFLLLGWIWHRLDVQGARCLLPRRLGQSKGKVDWVQPWSVR